MSVVTLHDDLRQLAQVGELIAPKSISKKRAVALQAQGWASIYPFHDRWNFRVAITEAGQKADRARAEPMIATLVGIRDLWKNERALLQQAFGWRDDCQLALMDAIADGYVGVLCVAGDQPVLILTDAGRAIIADRSKPRAS